MKTKIIFLLLCILPFYGLAQQDSLRFKFAGRELQKAAILSNTGAILQLSGGLFVASGIYSNNHSKYGSKNGDTYIYAGIGVSFIGFIVSIAAHGHIGKAGSVFKNGAIVIPLDKKSASKHQ